jgi:hypothetical protein
MLEKPGEKIGVPWRIDGRDAVSLDQGKQKIPDPLETEDPLHPHPRVLLIQEAADHGPDEHFEFWGRLIRCSVEQWPQSRVMSSPGGHSGEPIEIDTAVADDCQSKQ